MIVIFFRLVKVSLIDGKIHYVLIVRCKTWACYDRILSGWVMLPLIQSLASNQQPLVIGNSFKQELFTFGTPWNIRAIPDNPFFDIATISDSFLTISFLRDLMLEVKAAPSGVGLKRIVRHYLPTTLVISPFT